MAQAQPADAAESAEDRDASDADLAQFLSETPPPRQSNPAPARKIAGIRASEPAAYPVAGRGTVRRNPAADARLSEELNSQPAPGRTFHGLLVFLRSRSGSVAAAVVAFVVAIVVISWVYRTRSIGVPASLASSAASAAAATGTATFESNPSGAVVTIGGSVRGTTPLRIDLPVGEQVVEIGSGSTRRRLTAAITANVASSYFVDIPSGASADAAATADLGGLEVTSDPAGTQVSVDGVRRA